MPKRKKFARISNKETERFRLKETPPDYDTFKPAFSFRHMEYRGSCCLSRCDKNSKADIADTILQLSQLTWSQILSAPRKGMGKEYIPVDQFKVTLPDFVTPDVNKLMVFGFSLAGRIAGLRRNDVYHILIIGDDLYNH